MRFSVQQIEKLPDAQVALEGRLFLGTNGAGIVFSQECTNPSDGCTAKFQFQQRTGHSRRKVAVARFNNLVEDVSIGFRKCRSHGTIIASSPTAINGAVPSRSGSSRFDELVKTRGPAIFWPGFAISARGLQQFRHRFAVVEDVHRPAALVGEGEGRVDAQGAVDRGQKLRGRAAAVARVFAAGAG